MAVLLAAAGGGVGLFLIMGGIFAAVWVYICIEHLREKHPNVLAALILGTVVVLAYFDWRLCLSTVVLALMLVGMRDKLH